MFTFSISSKRKLNLMSDEDFLDVAPIIVSDIEDDDDDYNNNNNIIKTEITEECEDVKPPIFDRREERQKKINDEVMFKLYHSYESEWNIVKTEKFEELACETASVESEKFDEDSNDNLAAIIPETCYSEDESSESLHANGPNDSPLSESFGSLCDFTLWDGNGTETFSSPRAFVSTGTESSETIKSRSTLVVHQWKTPAATPMKPSPNTNTSFDAAAGHEGVGIPKDDCDLSNALNCLEVNNFVVSPRSVKQENMSDDTIASWESFGQLESTSDDDEDDEEKFDDENYVNNNFYTLPKLKAIEFSDLLTDSVTDENLMKQRKRKAPRENEKNIRPKKFIKTICELNGIKTVNYDYLTPELPDGVKMTNLSDSGSSTCHDVWYEIWNKETQTANPSDALTNGVIKNRRLIHDFLDINEPYLSESSSSSSVSVDRKKVALKKRLASQNASESSESDSSDSSSSSSESSPSMKSNNNPFGRLPGGANRNLKNLSGSSSLSGSDKSWHCNASSDDEDF